MTSSFNRLIRQFSAFWENSVAKQANLKRSSGDLTGMQWLAEVVLRNVLWLFFHVIYRIRVIGMDNVPREGPALLVCNHVTWLDGFFILLSLRRRIRFLVWTPYTKIPWINWLLKLGRVIPISSEAGPREIIHAMREASNALRNGELVGIFPEAALTRTGFMLPFQRGLEQILKRSPAPIIPTALDRLWGSIFSYQGGKFFWKWPRQVPYPVTVAFGKPLPADSSAPAIRQDVQKLLADCFNMRKNKHKPPHRQFVRMACKHPFWPCLIDGMAHGRKLNYAETLTGATLLARKLRPILRQEEMVGLLLPTTVGGALTNVAVAFLGKTVVNLNYTASKEALMSAIMQCKIRHVVTARAFRSRLPFDLGAEVQLVDLEDLAKKIGKVRKTFTYLSIVCLPGWFVEYWWLRLGKHKSGALASVIFSSGSTGEPKGVMLSHHNIISNVESVCQAIDPPHTDRLLGVLPFFHSFGFTVTLWLPLVIGASVVYYPDPRQAKEIGDLCKQHACTLFVTTPTFLRFFIRRSDKDDFRSLRMLITGAEKLPSNLAKDFADKFGIGPLEGYGTTELSPVASANVRDWEDHGWKQIGSKAGTVGQPLPGVAARVVDPDDWHKPMPHGQPGMLLIYGPNVMVGYLHRPEETKRVIIDGWYVTGDLALIDDDGFIKITDRLSRFSKIAGEMVPHQRIEEEIHRILNTTDRICAVTGVPDEKKGERLVVLHVDLQDQTVGQIHKRLTEGELPNLWLPSPKAFHQVPELPVLGSGKLDLQRVKKMALELSRGGE